MSRKREKGCEYFAAFAFLFKMGWNTIDTICKLLFFSPSMYSYIILTKNISTISDKYHGI
jgi:hypothetical protein